MQTVQTDTEPDYVMNMPCGGVDDCCSALVGCSVLHTEDSEGCHCRGCRCHGDGVSAPSSVPHSPSSGGGSDSGGRGVESVHKDSVRMG